MRYTHIHIYTLYTRIGFSDLWQWKVGNDYNLLHEEYDKCLMGIGEYPMPICTIFQFRF